MIAIAREVWVLFTGYNRQITLENITKRYFLKGFVTFQSIQHLQLCQLLERNCVCVERSL